MTVLQTLYCGIVPMMSLAGFYAFFSGKVLLSRQLFLTGVNARIVGLILLVPLFGVISAVCFESLVLSQPIIRVVGQAFTHNFDKMYHQTSHLTAISLFAASAWIFTFRRQVRATRTT